MSLPSQDRARGLSILRQFYDSSKMLYPFGVTYTFEEMLKTIESRAGGKTFADGLGLGAIFAEMSSSDTYAAMNALAKKAGGKIPSQNGDFKNFLIDQATSINFVDAVVYTASESAKDVVKGAQEIGDSVLRTGKLVTWLLPVAVIYFGYLYLKKKTA